MTNELEVQDLNPQEEREQSIVPVIIEVRGQPRRVWAHTIDMTSMVLEGLVPMPLLSAVTKMFEMKDASPAERLVAMGEAGGQEMINMLRRHAVMTVERPRITHEDDKNPEHLPVVLLGLNALMAIWTATTVLPLTPPVAAARFRPRAGTDAADVSPGGPDLPYAPVPLAEPVPESQPAAPREVAEIKHA